MIAERVSPSLLSSLLSSPPQCTCSKDMVKISMDPFVRLFQPERYQGWLQGKDPCPIDHTLATPGCTPQLEGWVQRRARTKPASKRYSIYTLITHILYIPIHINTPYTDTCQHYSNPLILL